MKKILCKLFGHRFHEFTRDCEKIRCLRCGKWFKNDIKTSFLKQKWVAGGHYGRLWTII
jgi:hypothetical protein